MKYRGFSVMVLICAMLPWLPCYPVLFSSFCSHIFQTLGHWCITLGMPCIEGTTFVWIFKMFWATPVYKLQFSLNITYRTTPSSNCTPDNHGTCEKWHKFKLDFLSKYTPQFLYLLYQCITYDCCLYQAHHFYYKHFFVVSQRNCKCHWQDGQIWWPSLF